MRKIEMEVWVQYVVAMFIVQINDISCLGLNKVM